MVLTFIRHGIAGANISEELRALTAEGRQQIERLSLQLQKKDEPVDLILSSPLLRTQQTAEIIANVLEAKDRLVLDPRLACGCHWSDLQSVLQEYRNAQTIFIVGHMPDLGVIASELLGLSQSVEFKKGSALKLKTPFFRAGAGTLLSFIHPE